jgi:hypothetical protein
MTITIGPGALAMAVTLTMALAGAIVYIVRLEGRLNALENVMQVKIGNVEATLKKHEDAIFARVRNVERIVGKARVFTSNSGDE